MSPTIAHDYLHGRPYQTNAVLSDHLLRDIGLVASELGSGIESNVGVMARTWGQVIGGIGRLLGPSKDSHLSCEL